ncbi:hypothetical protein ACFWP2_31185 [Kitasatospora sp. NPDC058444]|uniref:hypothetical protein n=1 Tax=Kitasatospora sp. NPDC058444 TaxID=3346504 RepID=UPI003662C415
MSDDEVVRSWKDPETARIERGHPLGEPDLTALSGGEEQITIFDICASMQTGCGTCGSFSVGCC